MVRQTGTEAGQLGPVNTKRWVALLGIWLPGEATKPGYTLCGLDRLRQQRTATRRARAAGAWFLRCSLGQAALGYIPSLAPWPTPQRHLAPSRHLSVNTQGHFASFPGTRKRSLPVAFGSPATQARVA